MSQVHTCTGCGGRLGHVSPCPRCEARRLPSGVLVQDPIIPKASVEERILLLEQKASAGNVLSHSVPGTTIQRVLCDIKILDQDGVTIPIEKRTRVDGLPAESLVVWSIGIGGLMDPKVWCFGYTIEDALSTMERKVDNLISEYHERRALEKKVKPKSKAKAGQPAKRRGDERSRRA